MRVSRLHLTDVTPSPDLSWARPTFPVYAFLIEHPDGPVLIDTGVGLGNAFIDQMYSPVYHDLDAALANHDLTTDDIATVITSHLHFDHCGQNDRASHTPGCAFNEPKPKQLENPSTQSPSGRSPTESS